MKTFNEIKETIASKKTDKERIKQERRASEIYQIEEFDGKIWLTCNGILVCPVDLFINKPVEILQEIRKLYVERTCKQKV